MPISATEYIAEGKALLEQLGEEGCLIRLLEFIEAEAPKGDPIVYGWVSVITYCIEMLEMQNSHSPPSIVGEEFWGDFRDGKFLD